MQKFLTVIIFFTLTYGISYGKDVSRQNIDRQHGRHSLLAQSDKSLPGRKFQSSGDERQSDRKTRVLRDERHHLERFRIAKLLELLELTDKQRHKFIPMFHDMRNEHRRITRMKNKTVEKLGKLLKRNKSSDKEIQGLIDNISTIEEQKITKHEDFLIRCSEILSPTQLGKLIVFHERFELKMLGKLRGFRDRKEQMSSRQKRPGRSIDNRSDNNFINNDSDQ